MKKKGDLKSLLSNVVNVAVADLQPTSEARLARLRRYTWAIAETLLTHAEAKVLSVQELIAVLLAAVAYIQTKTESAKEESKDEQK